MCTYSTLIYYGEIQTESDIINQFNLANITVKSQMFETPEEMIMIVEDMLVSLIV